MDRPGRGEGSWVNTLIREGASALLKRKKQAKKRSPETEELNPLPEAPGAGAFTTAAPAGFGPLLPHGPTIVSEQASPLDDELSQEAAPAGIAANTSPPKTPTRPPAPPPPPRRSAQSWLAQRASDSRLDAVRETVASPEVNASMSQKVAAEEAGRQAIKGDKLALKLALANLVEKLDMSSPKDSAVLMTAALGDQASLQTMALLGRGKMALEDTQGGQLFRRLAPVLQKVSPVDVGAEVDGAWTGMSEKFAKQAKGSVDVVVKSGSDAAEAGLQAAGDSAGDVGGAVGGKLTMAEIAEPDSQSVRLDAPSEGPKLKFAEVDEPADPDRISLNGTTPREDGLRIRELDSDASIPSQGTGASGGDGGDSGSGERGEESRASDRAKSESIKPKRSGKDALKIRELGEEVTESGDTTPVTPKESGSLRIKEVAEGEPAIAEVKVKTSPAKLPSGGKLAEVLSRAGGETRIAGKLSIQELLAGNADIAQVNVHEVIPAEGGGAPTLRSLGSMTRDALMQRLKF